MKKRIYILSTIILSIVAKYSYAQNLVPNYSFEVYDTCPFSSGQIYYASPWFDATQSVDYFNSCSNPGGGGVL